MYNLMYFKYTKNVVPVPAKGEIYIYLSTWTFSDTKQTPYHICFLYWPIAWYLGDIVVGWCSTRISASNSQQACGLRRGDTITIPFLIDERLTFFRAKEAVCPPRTSLTGMRLRWMDLTAKGMKAPRGSGPRSSVSLRRINPRKVVPDTTVPTPWGTHGVSLK